jgi:asparagine synthase (glutamine-hydrolysing)
MEFLNSIGSQVHLTGDAADAIFLTSPSYLADIIISGKFSQFIKHTHGSSRLWNLSFFSLIKSAMCLSFTSYQSWAYKQARLVEIRQKPTYIEESLGMGWSGCPSIGNWYTDLSLDLFARNFYENAETSPFSSFPGQNFSISELHTISSSCRILQQIADGYGVNLDFPYLESQIINTSLNTSIDQKFSPFNYKPLLQNALKDVLPHDVLKTSNSGDYTFDYIDGLQKNINDIRDFFDSSILHGMNIIDDEKIKVCLDRFSIGILDDLRNFNNTMGTEIWLRTLLNNNDNIWMN